MKTHGLWLSAALALLAAPAARAATTETTTKTTTVHHARETTRHTTTVVRDGRGHVLARTVVKRTDTVAPKHGHLVLPHTRIAVGAPPPPHGRHRPLPLAAHMAAHMAAHVPAHPAPKPVPVPAPPPAPVAKAAPAVDPNKGTATGLPLPRYAALRSDQVSFRAGPGTRYPIQWIYQRRDLPVKIEREFEVWRLVSVPDGFRGWVHLAMLTGRRGFFVTGDQPQPLRATASDSGDKVAILKPGVVGRLTACAGTAAWCTVQVQTYKGFISRDAIAGLLPGETVGP